MRTFLVAASLAILWPIIGVGSDPPGARSPASYKFNRLNMATNAIPTSQWEANIRVHLGVEGGNGGISGGSLGPLSPQGATVPLNWRGEAYYREQLWQVR